MATVNELLTQMRRDLDDPEVPGQGDDSLSLFGTEELVGYLNRAVDEACLRGRLLLDSDTPAVCRITLEAGKASYPLDSRVYRVHRARLVNHGHVLVKTGRADLDHLYVYDEYDRPVYTHVADWEDQDGLPRYFLQDMGANGLRVVPRPTENEVPETLALTVYRTQLEPLVAYKAMVQEPEIHPLYHYPLLDWVYYLALSKQDADTYDPEKASRNYAAFEARFGPRPSAEDLELERKGRPMRVRSHFF